MTDYSPGLGTIGESFGEDLGTFFAGNSANYVQNFSVRPTQPIAVYALGLYAQDEWSLRPNLRLTFSLRADHNSNPVCQTDCFAQFDNSFLNIAHNVNQPYNVAIHTGLRQALQNYDAINWEPRFGFAWSPFGAGTNTVIRGGIGIFADAFPATVADSFLNNSPLNNQFVVGGAGPAALSPDVANNQSAGSSSERVVRPGIRAAGKHWRRSG